MRALNHLLELSALQLASGSLALLAASTVATIMFFMIAFRLAGLPAGSVWVMLGLVRTAGPGPDFSLDDAQARRGDSAESLASLGQKVAAAGAGRPAKASKRSKAASRSVKK